MKSEYDAIYGYLARLESSKEKIDAMAAVRAAERQTEKALVKHNEKTRLLCSTCEAKLNHGSSNENLE